MQTGVIDTKIMAKAVKILALDMVEKAKSGHSGMAMGIADVLSVLWAKFLRFYPKDPTWQNRDRFILSAGHGCAALYAVLHLAGYDISLADLKQFRQCGSKTKGHPEYEATLGIETTTGPLGQGIANAVGMAIAARSLESKFPGTTDHHIYVVVGDGCLMEGVAQEAIALAGHQQISNLIVIFDDNGVSIDGKVDITTSSDIPALLRAHNWMMRSCDGHDHQAITESLEWAKTQNHPVFLACKTVIGHSSHLENSHKAHSTLFGVDEVRRIKANLGWSQEPFHIPNEAIIAWRHCYKRNENTWKNWHIMVDNHKEYQDFLNITNLPLAIANLQQLKLSELHRPCIEATRQSSGKIISHLLTQLPNLLGGSADLAHSTCTITEQQTICDAHNPAGQYIHYGVREHAMSSIMNGIALYQGFIPYGGTFLVFSDYMRPGIRLSQMMQQKVIYIFTHDSIALGEDGATHQPVEHLAALRAIPGLDVLRPCDAVETIECWQVALNNNGPTVLVLSRQKLEPCRYYYENADAAINMVQFGIYKIWGDTEDVSYSFFASGSEVSLAIKIGQIMEQNGIKTQVFSVPSWQHFAMQSSDYKKQIFDAPYKVVIEAGIKLGWSDLLQDSAILYYTVEDFGMSGPGDEVYKRYGFFPEKISETLIKLKNNHEF